MEWGSLIQTASAIATALIAVLVYIEAKRIRGVEWYSKTTANWNNFNQLILETGMDERWGRIVEGELKWSEVTIRDRLVIYSFLNVLTFEFNAKKKGLLGKDYAEKSVGDNVLLLRHIWPELHKHLMSDGWPLDFLEFADNSMNAVSE